MHELRIKDWIILFKILDKKEQREILVFFNLKLK